MGKKYLETKKDSLESSVLGVWQSAIEEGDARMDGRTKQYKSHRSKLEAARLRRGERNLNKEEVELNETVYEREEVEELYLELSDEEFDAILEGADEELLDNLEIFFTEDIQAISEKPGLLKKIGGAIAKRIPGTSAHRKKTIAKAASREKQRGAKAAKIKAKKKEKSDYKKAKAYLKTKKKASVFGDENDPVQEGAEGGTGDKKEYQKFFQKAMKKFGVTEPDQLKGDKRKEFYDYVDAGWEGDNEKAEQVVRDFKVNSMREALRQMWSQQNEEGDVGQRHPGSKPGVWKRSPGAMGGKADTKTGPKVKVDLKPTTGNPHY